MKFVTRAVPAVTIVVLLFIIESNAVLRAARTFIIDINANWRFGCNKGLAIVSEPEDLIVKGTLYFKNNNDTENAFSAGLTNFIIYERTKEGNYYNLINCKKFKKLKKTIEEPFLIVYKNSGIISGLKFSKKDTEFTKSLKYTVASEIQFDLGKLEEKGVSNSTFITEEKTSLGSCPVEYDTQAKHISDGKIGYNIMKNLLEDNCTRKNDNNSITSPDFCNDPSKMKAHATHKSEFDVAFKNKTGVFNNAKLFIAASSIPFKAISKTFNAFVTLNLKLNGMLQDGSLFPEFKDTGTELVKSLQETKLNESILKGKTGKSEKLQKVYEALSCLTWLPTTFHRDLVELALQCR